MEYVPLIMIPVLFVGIAYSKPYLKTRIQWNICAMCGAVFLTWLTLLIAWLFGAAVSPLAVGILMGMSVSGLMYKLEPFYKKMRIRNFWFVRIVIIIGGFYGVYLLLTERWEGLMPLTVFGLLALVIASFFFQGLTHEDVIKEEGEHRKKSLLKKLDDCC